MQTIAFLTLIREKLAYGQNGVTRELDNDREEDGLLQIS